MPPEVLEYLGVWTAITSSCIVVLVGMKIFLNHRRDIRIGRSVGKETDGLIEDVAALHDEVAYLRDGLEEVTERLEFHERLLTKAAEERVSTPV